MANALPETRPVPKSGGNERLSIRISQKTRDVIEDIKRNFGLRTDAEVMRHALGTQHRIGQSLARGEHIFVGNSETDIKTELVFVNPAR